MNVLFLDPTRFERESFKLDFLPSHIITVSVFLRTSMTGSVHPSSESSCTSFMSPIYSAYEVDKHFRQAFPSSVFVRYGQAFSSAPTDCPLRPAGRIPATSRSLPFLLSLPARGRAPCAVAVACPSGARAPRRGVAPAAAPLTFRSASLSLSQAEPPTARGRAACAAGLTTPTGALATPGTRG
jgi:hypothetical protein